MRSGVVRGLATLGLALLIGGAAYAFGAWSHAAGLWPISELRNLKRAAASQPGAVTRLDPFGRLLAFPGKVETPCPQQTPRTAVIAVFGGSNAGNYTGQRIASKAAGHAVNFVDGACYVAGSPLLGADNAMGEYWTIVADALIASGRYDDVVLSVTTVGDSVSADWAPGGRLARTAQDALAGLLEKYRPTRIIWDMGEDDYLRGLDPVAFTTNYRNIVAAQRALGAKAPVSLTVATKCMPDDYPWAPDNPIANAERKMPEAIAGLRIGVDRDLLIKTLDRRDDCHLGQTGAAKIAQAWVELVLSDR